MIARVLPMAIFLLAVPVAGAFAQAAGQGGTPTEQAACRPDTRKLCRQVRADADQNAFLTCLQANRAKLTVACRSVLEMHGL